MAKRRRAGKKSTDQSHNRISWAVKTVFFITFAYLALVIYAFTPYTHNLDEIKVSILYFGGPLLIIAYLVFAAMGELRQLRPMIIVPILGYFATLFISTLIAGKEYSWIGWIVQGFQIACLGGFLCCYGIMKNRDLVKKAFFWYMILGLGTTVFGLFHYAGGFQILSKIFITEEQAGTPMSILFQTFQSSQDDMFSTILNRQFYAAFLVMLLPISAAYAIIEDKNPWRRYAAIASTIFMAICLYLAHSKASTGAAVSAAVVFVVLYHFFARYKKIKIPHLGIWIAGLLIIVLTLGYFTADIGPHKFKTIRRSVESRAIIWKGGWDMFLYGPGPDNWYEIDNPSLDLRSLAIGCGPGTFRLIFPRYRSPEYHLHDISNVTLFSHNRFLDLLSENGLIGFAFYMFFLGAFFVMGMKRLLRSHDGEMRVYIIAIICSFLGILLSNIFSPNGRWAVVATNLWAIAGLGFGIFETSRDKTSAPEKSDKKAPASTLQIPSPSMATIMTIFIIAMLPIAFYCIKFANNRFKCARIHNNGLTMAKMGEYYQGEARKLQRLKRQNPSQAGQIQENIEKSRSYSTIAYQQAVEYYNQALKYNEYFITTYYKLAHSYNSLGELESAYDAYLELQDYAPDYSEVHFNLGVVTTGLASRKKSSLAEVKNNQKRAEILDEVQKLEKQSLTEFKIAAIMSNKPAVQEMYGRKLIVAKEYEKARDVYEFLRKRKPDNTDYIQTLAYICDRLNDYDSALEHTIALFKTDPTSEYLSSRIEKYYTELDKKEEFEDFLREFIGINPLDPRPRVTLLDLYMKRDEKEMARKQIAALTRIPMLIQRIGRNQTQQQKHLYQLAKSARNLEQQNAEIYFLEKCVELDKDSTLGKTCSERLREIRG